MSTLRYQIQLEHRRAPVSGIVELQPGCCQIIAQLPKGKLRRVTAEYPLETGPLEKIFMNGFQSWTYSPELSVQEYSSGIGPFPKPLIRRLGLEYYGDYRFTRYPKTPGVSHGESYCYFRNGNRFRLFASLDEEPGYTVFSYDCRLKTLKLERDCAGLVCEGEFHAFDLFFAEGNEDEVFDAWFSAMGVAPRTGVRIAGYSSWYNRYASITQKTIREDLRGCIGKLQPGDLFQIDDGWELTVGDWLDADARKFPDGMKQAASEIHNGGFRAGLWLAPFAATRRSSVFHSHPDWLLRENGKLHYSGCQWGGFYSLDIDNPAVRDYLRQVFDRVFLEWGYDLVKLDFLYAAAPFGNENESRAGRMLRAMRFLRELCGDRLILGCGVPLMPAFGLVDYCRIGCDVTLDWDDRLIMRNTVRERASTKHSISNTIFRRQLNGRAFLNDPDVFYLRTENLKLTKEEKTKLAVVNSLFGGVLFHSDNMGQYSQEQDRLYRYYLHLRDADQIRVEADSGLVVRYCLDGQEYSLRIA